MTVGRDRHVGSCGCHGVVDRVLSSKPFGITISTDSAGGVLSSDRQRLNPSKTVVRQLGRAGQVLTSPVQDP